MVEVIGKDEKVFEGCTCRKCASKLRYTLNDVLEYHGKDYSGGPDGKEWIVCPNCWNEVILRSW